MWDTLSIQDLKWANIPPEYIEVVMGVAYGYENYLTYMLNLHM